MNGAASSTELKWIFKKIIELGKKGSYYLFYKKDKDSPFSYGITTSLSVLGRSLECYYSKR